MQRYPVDCLGHSYELYLDLKGVRGPVLIPLGGQGQLNFGIVQRAAPSCTLEMADGFLRNLPSEFYQA